MRPTRLLTIYIGLALILGLILWLVNSLYQLYIQVSYTAPFLALLLVLLAIALLGLFVGTFLYYMGLLPGYPLPTKPGRRAKKRQIPVQKTAAAAETLQAIREQVTQIQDEVARQAMFLHLMEEGASIGLLHRFVAFKHDIGVRVLSRVLDKADKTSFAADRVTPVSAMEDVNPHAEGNEL